MLGPRYFSQVMQWPVSNKNDFFFVSIYNTIFICKFLSIYLLINLWHQVCVAKQMSQNELLLSYPFDNLFASSEHWFYKRNVIFCVQ